jgi:hypothetical protein
MRTFMGLLEMVSHLALEEEFRLFSFITEVARARGTGEGPAGKDNIPILLLKWRSGKMKKTF